MLCTMWQPASESKSDRHARQTKEIPMETGTRPFVEIAMDFVDELPESEGYNAILVITDRFTKVQHYIPANTNWTSADVANAYICYIWILYGLPRHVTSDPCLVLSLLHFEGPSIAVGSDIPHMYVYP